MLLHNLTIAIRNILKYKVQSLISLLGLAISFACVSLAVYWNHYEVSFDSFHSNADRIYRVRNLRSDINEVIGISGNIITPLKRDYPEIEKACGIVPHNYDIADINGNIIWEGKGSFSQVTSDLFDIFDFEWIEGNPRIIPQEKNKVFISDAVAKKICKTSIMGFQLLVYNQIYEVAGVYKAWSKHSNLKLDVIHVVPEENEKIVAGACIYALFKPHVNTEQFIHKIEKDTMVNWFQKPLFLNLWTPLKALHYTYPENKRNVHMSDVYLFTGFAILLSLCALLNYLTLFISRIRARGRDMALRVMCGSSAKQLGLLLMTEYFLLLLGSLLVSMLFIEIILDHFMILSQLVIERDTIYMGCGYFLLFILFLSLLLSIVPIFWFRKETLRIQIEATPVRFRNNRFRLTAVCIQLAISIFFMFCTTIMMKQIHHLLHADINVERKQIAVLQSSDRANRIMDILHQVPSVKEMVPIPNSLFPMTNQGGTSIESWEGKSIYTTPIHSWSLLLNDNIVQFYGINIKEGAQTFEMKEREVFVNETFAQKMEIINPVGKMIHPWGIIKGIIYDFQSQTPTSPVPPMMISPLIIPSEFLDKVAFKYEGDFSQCEKIIREIFEKEGIKYTLKDCEAEYRKLLEPEYNILKLMGVVFIISLLMALFGIYALVVQSCEQHRKEIAIRKVNGARVVDILSLFYKQYTEQVIVASLLALPFGYWLIKRWLEQYSIQTSITYWDFLMVFLATSIMVVWCVSWQVWQAANENPAKVIRKE